MRIHIYIIHTHVYTHIQLIRNIAGDIVERVELFDQFENKKTGKTSHAYRVTYRYVYLLALMYVSRAVVIYVYMMYIYDIMGGYCV